MGAATVSTPTVGTKLPELKIYGDPTFIVSTAIATRDYQDVHHDRDKAQAKGSKDIFVNILTDTGLVQRFLTDWAGPNAVVKSIGLRPISVLVDITNYFSYDLGRPLHVYDVKKLQGNLTVRASKKGEKTRQKVFEYLKYHS